jgi:hypothetical protein
MNVTTTSAKRAPATQPSEPCRDQLAQLGFTPDQIERLERLRDAYPFIEFVESGEQWRRLVFLKWLCATSLHDPATR